LADRFPHLPRDEPFLDGGWGEVIRVEPDEIKELQKAAPPPGELFSHEVYEPGQVADGVKILAFPSRLSCKVISLLRLRTVFKKTQRSPRGKASSHSFSSSPVFVTGDSGGEWQGGGWAANP
jgi:hypothetical protein